MPLLLALYSGVEEDVRACATFAAVLLADADAGDAAVNCVATSIAVLATCDAADGARALVAGADVARAEVIASESTIATVEATEECCCP